MAKADAKHRPCLRIKAVRLHAGAFVMAVVVAEVGRRDLQLLAFGEFEPFGHPEHYL